MKEDYIIINKTAIQKRIEKLSIEKNQLQSAENRLVELVELATLKKLLSQSTPLIPEIEKAFDAGRTVKNYKGEWKETFSDIMTSAKYKESKDYISNLKLDI